MSGKKTAEDMRIQLHAALAAQSVAQAAFAASWSTIINAAADMAPEDRDRTDNDMREIERLLREVGTLIRKSYSNVEEP